jgi:hypothetical protein
MHASAAPELTGCPILRAQGAWLELDNVAGRLSVVLTLDLVVHAGLYDGKTGALYASHSMR